MLLSFTTANYETLRQNGYLFMSLGTIAGDDTIFVAPKSIKDTQKLAEEIKGLLRN